MKIIKLAKLLSFLFVLSLMIVSCTKEGTDTKEIKEGTIDPKEESSQNPLLNRSVTSEQGLQLDCITILYSFDIIDNAGETHTISSDEDFIALLDSSNENYIVDFVYPLEIADEDGNTSTVNNGEELGESFANCLPNGWGIDAFPAYLINSENSCLTMLYPVTVSKLDGTTATYTDEASYVAALAEESLFFVFPISFSNVDGQTITVNDVDELLTALFECNGLDVDTTIWDGGFGFDFIGCYEIVFPFSVTLTDGTTVEVNDHMEYCDLLLEGNIAGFAFPMTLINQEGVEIVINAQEELDELLGGCFGNDPGDINGDFYILITGALGFDSLGINACYEINFPMSVTQLDWQGNDITELTVNSLEELLNLPGINSGEFEYTLVYPVSVTIISTQVVITFNQIEDIFATLEECQ